MMAIAYLLLIDFKACTTVMNFQKFYLIIKEQADCQSNLSCQFRKGYFSRFRTVFYCFEIKNQTKKKLVVSCIRSINLFEREFYHAKVSKTKRTRNETINGRV